MTAEEHSLTTEAICELRTDQIYKNKNALTTLLNPRVSNFRSTNRTCMLEKPYTINARCLREQLGTCSNRKPEIHKPAEETLRPFTTNDCDDYYYSVSWKMGPRTSSKHRWATSERPAGAAGYSLPYSRRVISTCMVECRVCWALSDQGEKRRNFYFIVVV